MDVFRKLTLASIGAYTVTREKAEELFDEMVKKGEMTSDEKAEALKNFVNKSVESTEKMSKWLEDAYQKLSTRLSGKFDEQISKLSERIEQINVKLAGIEKKLDKKGSA
jgi:polyhydroxyalkanoate synthesis regulator phasin